MRVALYARVSTKTQERNKTIASQTDSLRDHAKRQGYTIAEEFVCLDDGVSGATLARRGLDRLRDGAEAGQFDSVLVLSPDRLSRRYAYLILIQEELQRLGVSVLYLEQPPGDDPQTALLTQIQGAVAEYERVKIAERYRRGKLYRARQGEVFWTSIPFGYRHVPRRDGVPAHVEIDETQAPLVRSMFAWHAEEGLTVRQVAKRLTRTGVPTPKGGSRWGLSTVHRILTREAYLGTLYYNRSQHVAAPVGSDDGMGARSMKTTIRLRPREEWISVSIPAIIDLQTFERSQARHAPNKQFSPRRLKEERWLLRRLLRCGRCGYKHACASGRKNKEVYVWYYRCGKQDGMSKRPRCSRNHVRADALDRLVWQSIRRHLLDPELLLRAKGEIEGSQPTGEAFVADQLHAAERRLSQAHGERSRLLDAYQNGFVPKPEFEERARKLAERITGLEMDVKGLQEERRLTHNSKQILDRVEDFTHLVTTGIDTMTFHERQTLARQVLDEVVLDGNHVQLYFKIPLPRRAPDASGSKDTPPKRGVSSQFGLRSRPAYRVKVRVPSQRGGAEGLDGDDHTRGDLFLEGGVEVGPHRHPGTFGQLSKKLSFAEKKRAKNFGQAEDHLAVRQVFEDVLLKPFGPFQDSTLVA